MADPTPQPSDFTVNLRGGRWWVTRKADAKVMRSVMREDTAHLVVRRLCGLPDQPAEGEAVEAPKPTPPSVPEVLPLSALMLTPTQVSRLMAAGVSSAQDLAKRTRDELIALPGVGVGTAEAAMKAIAAAEL